MAYPSIDIEGPASVSILFWFNSGVDQFNIFVILFCFSHSDRARITILGYQLNHVLAIEHFIPIDHFVRASYKCPNLMESVLTNVLLKRLFYNLGQNGLMFFPPPHLFHDSWANSKGSPAQVLTTH